MLLRSPAKLHRDDESGSALIGVLALMMVAAVIGVTIATAAIHGLGVTSSARAGVQARAAAEAGIDIAVAGLKNEGEWTTAGVTYNKCTATGGVYESPSPSAPPTTPQPKFRSIVQYDGASGTWVNGCPPATATQVRIQSTGFADAKGVAGASSGDSQVIEAIYNYIPDYVTIPHIDAAVYAHTMTGDLRSFNLDSADNNLAADLQIKSGNVNCINGARIAGDVILADGAATLKNCDVTGSIHVSRSVSMDIGSEVFGDVIAVGQSVTGSANVVALEGGSIVRGDVYSGGNASVTGNGSVARQNITVAGTSANRISVTSQAKVLNNAISSGTVALSGQGTVGGTVSSAVVGLQSPPVPLIPNWTDVPYPSPTWAAHGYEEVMWTGSCTVGGTHDMWTSLSARTTPTVVNALGCGAAGLVTESNIHDLTLNANIAFIAHAFNINKLYAASNVPTTIRNLWFIVPDNTTNGLPTCTAPSGGVYLHSAANIDMSIAAMAYTPCKITSDRDGWRGQLYGGEVEFGQQAKLTFVPVGVPGVDFSGGVPPTVVLSGGHLGNRVTVRELGSGG